jgi:starvation-inducible DNA-binding protein
MNSPATSTYLPPLEVNHEREGTALEDHLVVRELTHRIAEVSEQVRDRMNRLGDADLVSQDVLIEVVRQLEEQQWMLRAQLGENV